MNKEILDTLNELSKKPITELAMSYMEVVVDNIVKDKEIARLNYIIDCYVLQIEELMQIILEQPTEDKENDKWLLDKLNGIKKIKELKEEGK